MWYYVQNNQRFGPFDEATIQNLVQNQTINANTLVWQDGMADWMPLQATALGSQLPAFTPPPSYAPVVPATPGYAAAAPYGSYPQPQYGLYKLPADQIKSLNDLFQWSWILMIVAIPTSFIVIGIFAAIASMVLLYMLLYRYWEIIQDGYHRATPGQAVGFMFIPFFNFYWVFQAVKGLAEDMNRYTQERGIAAPQANTGLALAYCILICVSIIPYVNFVSGTAALIIMFILWSNFKEVASAIWRSRA